MKCPKCGYLGYAHADKCRNCGYEFALNEPDTIADLRLNDREQVPAPLQDVELLDRAARPAAGRSADRQARRGDTPNGLAELPLFGGPIDDDEPLITMPSAPRQPLGVRRGTPDVPRLKAEPRAPVLDWADPSSGAVSTRSAAPTLVPDDDPEQDLPSDTSDTSDTSEPAGFGSRALAAGIDVVLMLIVDVVVVYFTLKICRLPLSEIAILPKGPLFTFLLLQNGGYFVAFTATGQTVGKMIAGVKVLADDEAHAPDLGRSVLRAGVWLLLALPAGLGLLTTLLMRDGRGLHDRFAGTRVVRAGA